MGWGMENTVQLTTEIIDPESSNEVWRETMRPFFDAQAADKSAMMRGSLQVAPIGAMLIGPTRFNAQVYRRDRRLAVSSGLDHYLIAAYRRGRYQIDFDGLTRAPSPGDICLYDLARPFSSQVDAGETLTLSISRRMLDAANDGRSLHGALIRGGDPLGQVLNDYLATLWRTAATMNTEDAAAAEHALAILIAGAARDVDAQDLDGAAPAALQRAVCAYIETRLSDPDLGPAALMEQFGISRAHLYRLFAEDGGVGRHIRARRLDAFYRSLTAPGRPDRPISELAREWGFSSSDQLHRAFKDRFGVTPGEARADGFDLALGDRGLHGVYRHFAGQAERIKKKRDH